MKNKFGLCKARIASLLLVAVALTAFLNAAEASDTIHLNDTWGYRPSNISYADGTFRMDGYFFNHSASYDIGDLADFTLILYDADGRPFIQIDGAAGDELKGVIFASGATYEHTFIVTDCVLDASGFNFSSFYAEVQCSYECYPCRGAGSCDVCAPWRDSIPVQPTPLPTLTRQKCEDCDGKGSTECILCEDGVLYYEKKRSIDIGGGSSVYEVPVYCRLCKNGRVDCYVCGKQGWVWVLPELP